MKALTYIEHGKFALLDKPKPVILDPRDAIVRVKTRDSEDLMYRKYLSE